MSAPVVVICGRPNVGKSSIFNAILGRRVAIVDPTAGVTRDRVNALVERGRRRFMLVDTGGIGQFDEMLLRDEVEHQIEIALEGSDLILFLVDARDGVLPADEEIARKLRALGKPIVVVANKCDGINIERELGPVYRLGFGEPFPVSAVAGFGVQDLVEHVLDQLPGSVADADDDDGPPADDEAEETADPEGADAFGERNFRGRDPKRPIRLAIVGKVNSGKSTLVNLLVGEQRVIVSDLAGTTRDAIDVPFDRLGRRFVAVDTAGLRKRRVVEGTPDFYAQGRAMEAIRRADVVLLLVDASRKISQIDKALASAIAKTAKPVVIGVTKWDLAQAEGKTPEQYKPYIQQQLPLLDFAPVTFLSALNDFNVDGTLRVAKSLFDQAGHRVATGELNRVIEQSEARRFPRTSAGKFPKVLYATQTGVHPPTVVVFVNDARLFGDEYARYLSNRLRESFPFDEIPLRVLFRERRPGTPNQGPPA